jgi:microsomal epoxide hydrolase
LPEVSTLPDSEKVGYARGLAFQTNGTAYAQMHASRPSTISHVLASSPLALLAWVGEKYLEWTDEPHPDYEQILNLVTLWWVTETYQTSIYSYRGIFIGKWPQFWDSVLRGEPLYLKVPMGYSYFPKEIVPTPEAWARMTGNLVYFSRHDKVGNH